MYFFWRTTLPFKAKMAGGSPPEMAGGSRFWRTSIDSLGPRGTESLGVRLCQVVLAGFFFLFCFFFSAPPRPGPSRTRDPPATHPASSARSPSIQMMITRPPEAHPLYALYKPTGPEFVRPYKELPKKLRMTTFDCGPKTEVSKEWFGRVGGA